MKTVAMSLAITALLCAGCAAPDEPTLTLVVEGDADDATPAVITATLHLTYDTTYLDPGCGAEQVVAHVTAGPVYQEEDESVRLYDYGVEPAITACVEREVQLPKGDYTYTFEWNGRIVGEQPEPHSGFRLSAGPHEMAADSIVLGLQARAIVNVA